MKTRHPDRAFRRLLLPGLVFGACVATGWAQTVTWTGSASKFWGGNSANWSPSGIPASDADLLFDGTATLFAVDLGTADRTAGSITLDSATAYSFEDVVAGQTLTPGDVTVLSGTGHVFGVPIVLAADATYDIASGTGLAISGVVGGSGALTKAGAGSLTLSGANTFTGATTVNAGSLILGNALALQSSTVTLNVDAGLDLNSYSATLGGLAGAGDLALGANTITVGGNGASTSYTGVLSGTGGLTKTGAGTLSLSGVNSFTGAVTIDAGVIDLVGDGSALDGNTSLQNNTVSINVDGGLNLSNAYVIYLGGLAGSGDLALGDNDVYVGGNGAGTTYGGAFSVDSGSLTKEGSGTLTLTGAGHDLTSFDVDVGEVVFDGSTGSISTIDWASGGRGTFQNGADFSISSLNAGGELLVTGEGTELTVARVSNGVLGTTLIEDGAQVTITDFGFTSGVSMSVNQATLSISGLQSNGLDTNPGKLIYLADGTAGSALTIDVSSGTAKFRNTVADYGSGSGSITKTGAGTLIISAATNTYTGGTIITGGTLQIGDGGTTGSIVGDVANAGALVVNRSDASTLPGVISGTGTLTQSGVGSLTLGGANTFTGATTVNAGSIIIGNALALQASTVTFNVDNGLDPNGLDATLGALAGAGAGDIALGTGSLTVGGNGASTSYTGVLSGTGGLTKTGAGTLSLSGVNTFTGDVTIDAGVLDLVGDGSAADYNTSLQNNTVTIAVDGGLNLSNAYTIYLGGLAGSGNLALGDADVHVGGNGAGTTYGGAFSALNATLTKEGSGTLTLTGADHDLTYFEIDGGEVVFDGAAGSIFLLDWNGTRRATFQNGADFTLSLKAGELLVTGEGTTLAVTSVFSDNLGTTLIEDGAQVSFTDFGFTAGVSLSVDQATLSISGLNSTGSDTSASHPIYLADGTDGSALTINVSSGTAKFRSPVADYGSGSGSITKTGAGTLVFTTATNTYTGGTTIEGGTVSVADGDALGSGAIVFDGGILTLTASNSLENAVNVSSGGGTITTSDTMILSGDVTLDGGTLAASDGLLLAGLVSGEGGFSGPVTVSGTLSPGSSTGTLSIEGDG